MWDEAINAVKGDDISYINDHHKQFRTFFRNENILEKGKLNDNALKKHYEHKLFKLFVDRSLNGLELDLGTGAKWIENASRLDGNWGWLLAIGVGGGYFTEYLEEKVRTQYFYTENALISGSGKPSGKAEKTAKGWKLNGSWDFCSGSEQASLFTAVTLKEGEISAVAIPAEMVRIKRNWNPIGLELTCSHTILAEDLMVREDHFFNLAQMPAHSEYPLGSYPFDLFARVCFVPVIIGLFRSILHEVKSLRDLKKKSWLQFHPQKYQALQNLISEIQTKSEDEIKLFYTTVDQSWTSHKRKRDVMAKTLQKSSLSTSKFCYESAATIIPLLSMEVMEKDHPIQECWRDLQTAYQHMIFREY